MSDTSFKEIAGHMVQAIRQRWQYRVIHKDPWRCAPGPFVLQTHSNGASSTHCSDGWTSGRWW